MSWFFSSQSFSNSSWTCKTKDSRDSSNSPTNAYLAMRQQLKVFSSSETIILHIFFQKRCRKSVNSSETFSCSNQGESCPFLVEKTASLGQIVSVYLGKNVSSSIYLFGVKIWRWFPSGSTGASELRLLLRLFYKSVLLGHNQSPVVTGSVFQRSLCQHESLWHYETWCELLLCELRVILLWVLQNLFYFQYYPGSSTEFQPP